jgi:hypothetical protein
MVATAGDLAARFDARNGTSYQTSEVARQLATPPLTVHLRLSTKDKG